MAMLALMAVLSMLSMVTPLKRRLHHIQHRVMDHLTKTSSVAIGYSVGGLGLGSVNPDASLILCFQQAWLVRLVLGIRIGRDIH